MSASPTASAMALSCSRSTAEEEKRIGDVSPSSSAVPLSRTSRSRARPNSPSPHTSMRTGIGLPLGSPERVPSSRSRTEGPMSSPMRPSPISRS